MEDDKITLDRKTFKTLSSDTRVGILKSLSRRRKMLTELSKEFGMSPSTIKEHLDNLSRAELVVMKDDGHKWKYYDLTRKGKDVLNPGETKIWIVLALSAFAIILTSYDFVQNIAYRGGQFLSGAAPLATEVAGEAADKIATGLPGNAVVQPLIIPPIPQWHIVSFVVFSVLLGLSLGYVLAKKRFYAFQWE